MSHRSGAERQCERHKDEHGIPNGSCPKVECHFCSSFLVYSITHPAAETIEESAALESHPRLSRVAREPCRSASPAGVSECLPNRAAPSDSCLLRSVYF